MAVSRSEIITLQLGNYSNFVGTHFWNLQEALLDDIKPGDIASEINHDILYREGQNINGEKTYKPRTICFDFKPNLTNITRRLEQTFELETMPLESVVDTQHNSQNRPINSANNLQELGENLENLASRTASPSSQTSPLNSLSFEDSIESWLDYSLVKFHEKSFHIIEGIHKEDSQVYGNFGVGQQLFESQIFQNDFEDKLHFFVEECDRFQGFQIFSDVHDFFGGLASGILEGLAEEYSKKIRLCFPMMPATFQNDTRHSADQRLLNILLGLSKYTSDGSMVVPLCLRNSFGLRSSPVKFPWVEYKEQSNYHTSAILASAIDTATLSHRLTSLDAFGSNLCLPRDSRNISTMCIALPVPVSSTFTPRQLVKDYQCLASHFTMLTPDVPKPRSILSESVVLRGLPTHLLSKSDQPNYAKQLTLIQESTVKQYQPGSNSSYIIQQPSLLPSHFPDLFAPSVTPVGCVVYDYHRPEGTRVHKTSVMTSLQCSEEIGNLLETVVSETRRTNIKKQSGFLEAGVELDDIETSSEELIALAQLYRNKHEL